MKLIDIDRAIIDGIDLFRQKHYGHFREEPTRLPVFQGGGVSTAVNPPRMVRGNERPICGTGSFYFESSAPNETAGTGNYAPTRSD